MSRFQFVTDSESFKFAEEVLRELVDLFKMSEEEAVGRINRHWKGQAIIGPNDPIYHESPDFYAKLIYYGPGVPFWKGEDGLTCCPYP